MSRILYIGIEISVNYPADDWPDYEKTRIRLGVEKIEFRYNSLARIFDGNIFEVELKKDDCLEFFKLRLDPGMYIIPQIYIMNYMDNRKDQYSRPFDYIP
jgi:hypothetical protein